MNRVLIPLKNGSCDVIEFDQEWLLIACCLVTVARGEPGIPYEGLDRFIRRTYCQPPTAFSRDVSTVLLLRLKAALEYCGIDGKYAVELREATDQYVAFAFGMQEGHSTLVVLGKEPYLQIANGQGVPQKVKPAEVEMPKPIDAEPPPDTGNPFQSAKAPRNPAPEQQRASQNPFLSKQGGAAPVASLYEAPVLPSLQRSLPQFSNDPFDDVNLQPRGNRYASSGSPFPKPPSVPRRQWKGFEVESGPPEVVFPDEPDTLLVKRLTAAPGSASQRVFH
jgi:hypothetical protein